MNQQALTNWLHILAAEVKKTKPEFARNVVPGFPIPFFGNVLKARVLTVGVNPSSGEFRRGRQWKRPLKLPGWQERLLSYFNWPEVPAHEWFETWSICLELLSLSYAGGEAAHVDVSPRPTIPMLDEQTDKGEFRAMVEHDVRWFFQLLGKLQQVQLLLVAGPIPGENDQNQQLADFIKDQAKNHHCRWLDRHPLPTLTTPGRCEGIPVFVCPYERGVDGLYSMVRQVYRNRGLLRPLTAKRNQ
jgi:hypothetical protein